ncbi:hypothetical protein GTCCBUS3UF5_5050 [Geobacillus thermoleovorans CCB_US3_UF5]|uniref:Uncharacterized protein n=1 Tax=Geobacillus thermoleovorans CCB_US3_UF5 TaxID=1111068 RepID=A0ABM5MDS0_GEOTH|nr:hypothetical protein GTCCBUS3UF5_5050 [Geobacillus thermoleovorans CCB_US3_UF5]GAJ60462.1 hypothetical protein B23_3707 [Geobacillus thermoleovorans B23]
MKGTGWVVVNIVKKLRPYRQAGWSSRSLSTSAWGNTMDGKFKKIQKQLLSFAENAFII